MKIVQVSIVNILFAPEELVDEGQLQEERGESKSSTGAYILVREERRL
ncbi:hypothetical protein [Candidatus Tisiphia endosymbiont of Beris chalybata]